MKLPTRLLATTLATLLAAAAWSDEPPRVQVLEIPAQTRGDVSNPGLWREFSLYRPDPAVVDADAQQPILFFLHGAGRRGKDPAKVQSLPPLAAAGNGHDFPFIIAAPQVIPGRTTSQASVLAELETFFEDVIELTNADRSRVYIAGQSMGGRGAWELLMRQPDYFAAGIPIAGASDRPQRAAALTDVPIWAFHGRQDNVVPVQRSIELIDTIEAAGGDLARLTIYEDGGHSVWWQALRKDSEVYDWMIAQQLPEPGVALSAGPALAILLIRRPVTAGVQAPLKEAGR